MKHITPRQAACIVANSISRTQFDAARLLGLPFKTFHAELLVARERAAEIFEPTWANFTHLMTKRDMGYLEERMFWKLKNEENTALDPLF